MKRFLWIFIFIFLGACDHPMKYFRFIPGLEEDIKLDPCDSASNVYLDGQHYIDSDFLNEDGQINYNMWFEKSRPENSNCDPLKSPKKTPLN